jgi:hypothetical protein
MHKLFAFYGRAFDDLEHLRSRFFFIFYSPFLPSLVKERERSFSWWWEYVTGLAVEVTGARNYVWLLLRPLQLSPSGFAIACHKNV